MLVQLTDADAGTLAEWLKVSKDRQPVERQLNDVLLRLLRQRVATRIIDLSRKPHRRE